ncbi:MAG: hypothetical protein ACREU9_00120 [Gammaproteobacteria bacterium]
MDFTHLVFLFFGILMCAGIAGMAKIQRDELLASRDKKAQQQNRIEAFRAKCYRPDGD